MIGKPKDRTIAILLALAGLALPGIHKFYLGRPAWGLVYLLPGLIFWGFPLANIPRIASLIEGVWYLLQGQEQFNHHFNPDWPAPPELKPGMEPERVEAIARALRQLDSLRQEGLITEYEFEQQRRQLLGS